MTIWHCADGDYHPIHQTAFHADFVLPARLQEIEEQAFMGISASSIRIPDGCTSIGCEAFSECDNLSMIYIPASVTLIHEDAFDFCGPLTVIYGESDTLAEEFAELNGITFIAVNN